MSFLVQYFGSKMSYLKANLKQERKWMALETSEQLHEKARSLRGNEKYLMLKQATELLDKAGIQDHDRWLYPIYKEYTKWLKENKCRIT